jgi:nucleotide-binding universal stress UspA family protein
MDTILVGYDDTPASHVALKRAVRYARAFDAALVVASVVPVMVGMGRGMGAVDPVSDESEHKRQLESARSLLEQDSTGPALTVSYVSGVGDPADTLVALADQHDATLVVVGTREPSLVARFFGQSVSAGVARHSHRDVLIVHGAGTAPSDT